MKKTSVNKVSVLESVSREFGPGATVKPADVKKFCASEGLRPADFLWLFNSESKVGHGLYKLPNSEAPTSAAEADPFTIDERFEFVTNLVNMVAKRITPSALITGEGGLGKTFTVIEALTNAGMVQVSDMEDGESISDKKTYTVVKGYSTAKGLFRTLYENKNRVIVFDDCDSILKDVVALNLLKAALDSYSTRIISYNADIKDEDLPRSFEFKGGIIFISNMTQQRMDNALMSRSMNVDLSMTADQKIERMQTLISFDSFMPTFSRSLKMEALAVINTHRHNAKELSLRTLIKITKIASEKTANWEKLAQYVIAN